MECMKFPPSLVFGSRIKDRLLVVIALEILGFFIIIFVVGFVEPCHGYGLSSLLHSGVVGRFQA